MRRIVALISVVMVLFLFIPSTWAQHTIWHSPLNHSTYDEDLNIYPFQPSTSIRIVSSETGDLKWIDFGLVLPSTVQIDSVILGYEIQTSANFISQVRLTKMKTPDVAMVHHDDPTDLNVPGLGMYTSVIPENEKFPIDGTVTLSLRLNFGSTQGWIDIGAIGICVSSPTSSARQAVNKSIPDSYRLRQNFPNPFNPNTNIEYDIQKPGFTEIVIYNALGQKVRTLVNETKTVGSYQELWDGKNDSGEILSTGTYFYQLKVDDFVGTKKMLLIK